MALKKKKIVKKTLSKKGRIDNPNQIIGSDIYTSLTSLAFTFKGKKYEVDVGEELLVDSDDLHSQIERIPAVLGYFSSIVAMLDREYRDKKTLAKKIEAQIDQELREAGIVGEARIVNAIRRNSRWVEAYFEVNKAIERVNRARHLWAALREKAIVLLSRSSDIRGTPSDSIRGVKRDEVVRLNSDLEDFSYDDDEDDDN